MKFKNILNKPYKYLHLYQYNNYYHFFNQSTKNYFKFIYKFNTTQKQLKNIYKKFSTNIYKSFLVSKLIQMRLEIKLIQIGITKTIKQSRHLIRYGKILINGILSKNPGRAVRGGDFIKIIPILYIHTSYNNLSIFKNYLSRFNNINNITQYHIFNINNNTLYLSQLRGGG